MNQEERKNAVSDALAEYLHDLYEGPHDESEEKMIFDELFSKIEQIFAEKTIPMPTARKGKWEPRQSDIDWMNQLIRTLKDGGSWAIPDSRTIFTFWKGEKAFSYEEPKDCPAPELNRRTVQILHFLGWKEK